MCAFYNQGNTSAVTAEDYAPHGGREVVKDAALVECAHGSPPVVALQNRRVLYTPHATQPSEYIAAL